MLIALLSDIISISCIVRMVTQIVSIGGHLICSSVPLLLIGQFVTINAQITYWWIIQTEYYNYWISL